MIQKETAVAAPITGGASFEVQSTPDGFAVLTVTYGVTTTTIQLPIDDMVYLAAVVNGFLNWQPAPLSPP